MVIVLLQVRHGETEALGEVAILLVSQGLVLEDDQSIPVEQVLDLLHLCGCCERVGIDAIDAAPDC
jgi:hypothetical protein